MAIFKNPDRFQSSDEAKKLQAGSADPYSHVGYPSQGAQPKSYTRLSATNEDSDYSENLPERKAHAADPFAAVYDNLRNYGAATLVSVDDSGQWISEVPQVVLDEIIQADEKIAESKRKAEKARADARKQAEEQNRQIAQQLGLSNFPKNLA